MTRWTHAIVTRLPNSLAAETNSHAPKIDLQKARREQEQLCDHLREAGVDVFELVPEEHAPASTLFVEDVAIVCNGTALVARPSHKSRRVEIVSIFSELGMYLFDTAKHPDTATIALDGGDVLFTGREFFVGIGKKTNVAGAMEVARAFPEYPVTPVKISGNHHNLKQHVCLAAPNVLAVGASKESQNILKRIEREATFRYQTLTLNDDSAINCLNVNGTLLYRPEFHGCAEKFGALQDVKLCPVEFSELAKLGGSLSQHCLLLRRIKLLKNL